MSGTGTQTIDDLLSDLARAEASEQYRRASVERMRALIQAGAVTAFADATARIMRDALPTVAENPATGPSLGAGIEAAVSEGQRLLRLLGVDVDAIGKGG